MSHGHRLPHGWLRRVCRTCGAAAHSTKTCEKLSRPSYRVVRAPQRSRLHSVSRSLLRRISNASSERSVERVLRVKRNATVETRQVDTAVAGAAILAMFGCPSWSSKGAVASPERLTTAVPPDVDQVTTEVVPVVAEDPAVKLQHMMERVHDLREVRARAAPGPNAFAVARFGSDAGVGDVPTDMPSILIDTPWSEITETRKAAMERPRDPLQCQFLLGDGGVDHTGVMVEHSAPTSSSTYWLLRHNKKSKLCVAWRLEFAPPVCDGRQSLGEVLVHPNRQPQTLTHTRSSARPPPKIPPSAVSKRPSSEIDFLLPQRSFFGHWACAGKNTCLDKWFLCETMQYTTSARTHEDTATHSHTECYILTRSHYHRNTCDNHDEFCVSGCVHAHVSERVLCVDAFSSVRCFSLQHHLSHTLAVLM